jgi:farnesyl-diphosphate farnesyltransferase
MNIQIEQFIESVFPSQKPGQPTSIAITPEAEEKERKDKEEAKWDTIYMSLAVLTTLFVVTVLMVCLALINPQFLLS